MEVSTDYKILSNKRKFTRGNVTKIHDKIADIPNWSSGEKLKTQASLLCYQTELSKLNDAIQKLSFEHSKRDDEMHQDLTRCEEYNEKIEECLILLNQSQAVPAQASSVALNAPNPNASSLSSVARSLLKTPTAPLPHFKSTEEEDFLKFIAQFEETISKFNYEDYDKFLLLKQQISGRALFLIESLDPSEQSYEDAKNLLSDALAAPEIQKANAINRLLNLKLSYDSEPFEFISKVCQIRKSAKRLKMTAEDFIAHFVWNSMNEKFKNHMIHLTNKTHPTLDEINSEFFKVTERYESSQSNQYKNPKSKSESVKTNQKPIEKASVGLAANVQYRKINCSICLKENKNSDHFTAKCPNYIEPKDKIERLKQMNACTKCAYTNHSTANCNFHFKRSCATCNGWHFDFLCVRSGVPANTPKKSDSKSKQPKQEKVEAKDSNKKETTNAGLTIITEALPNRIQSETILPTFTCEMENNALIRSLKDGGCQSTFLRRQVAIDNDLKVTQKNVSLKVNGFNTAQTYQTEMVEIKLKFGDKIHTIEAICIPEINIELNLPGLNKIVKTFLKKGYSLADKFLTNGKEKISNIDLILGSGSAHCILDNHICFCHAKDSVFSDTHMGVLLMGDISTIKKNLDDFPYVSNYSNHSSQNTNETFEYYANSYNFLCFGKPKSDSEESYFEEIKFSESNANFSVIDDNGRLIESKLQKATNEVLENQCFRFTNYDFEKYDESSLVVNKKLVKFALDKTTRDETGRLTIPLLWN